MPSLQHRFCFRIFKTCYVALGKKSRARGKKHKVLFHTDPKRLFASAGVFKARTRRGVCPQRSARERRGEAPPGGALLPAPAGASSLLLLLFSLLPSLDPSPARQLLPTLLRSVRGHAPNAFLNSAFKYYF